MTRKQMIGIKERVERGELTSSSDAGVAIPIDTSAPSESIPSLEPEWATQG